MRCRLFATPRPAHVAWVLALATVARGAGAQNGPPSAACAAQRAPVQDACQKALDTFQFLAPQLGAVVAGGNVEPGQGGADGGLGRFGLSVRANVLRAPLPQFGRVTLATGAPQRSTIPTSPTLLAFPVADASIGLFRGLPIGLTTAGGVDLLLNATYVPTIARDQLSVRPRGGSFQLGYGVRLGLLQESALVPGVSVSVLRRETPATDIVATSGSDSLRVSGARVRTDSWRLTASKRLLIVAVAAGVGQDRYLARAAVSGVVNELGGAIRQSVAPITASQRLTRTTYFANLTLAAVPLARLVGEVGRSSGGSLAPTYNSFDGRRPDAAYTYASVGLRVGF